MFIFISNTERTTDVIDLSVNIDDNIREAPNSLIFDLKGNPPSEFDNIKAYAGLLIVEAGADYVVLNKAYSFNNNQLFRAGDILTVAINEADEEEGIILEVTQQGGLLKIILNASFLNVPAQNRRLDY